MSHVGWVGSVGAEWRASLYRDRLNSKLGGGEICNVTGTVFFFFFTCTCGAWLWFYMKLCLIEMCERYKQPCLLVCRKELAFGLIIPLSRTFSDKSKRRSHPDGSKIAQIFCVSGSECQSLGLEALRLFPLKRCLPKWGAGSTGHEVISMKKMVLFWWLYTLGKEYLAH